MGGRGAVGVGRRPGRRCPPHPYRRRPAAVMVLVGPAGTGKTFTLDAVRAAFEQAGHTVVGAAPSARAAIELAGGAGIRAAPCTRCSTSGGRPRRPAARVAAGGRRGRDGRHPHPRSGRHPPDPPPAAGCCWSATTTSCPRSVPAAGSPPPPSTPAVVAELTVNRRQRQPWEQAALAELRDGSVARAVEAYLAHGRVVVTDSPQAMIAAAVDHWFAARDAGLDPVLLAGTNDLVDRLNQAVIARLTDAGELDGATSGSGRACSGSVSGSSCAATAPNTPSVGRRCGRRQRAGRHASPPSRPGGSPSASTAAATRWCSPTATCAGAGTHPRLRAHHPPGPGRHVGPGHRRRRRRPVPRRRLRRAVPRRGGELARAHRPRSRRAPPRGHRRARAPRHRAHPTRRPTRPRRGRTHRAHRPLPRQAARPHPRPRRRRRRPPRPTRPYRPLAVTSPRPPAGALAADGPADRRRPRRPGRPRRPRRPAPRVGASAPPTATTSAPSPPSNDTAATATVQFVSADGRQATRTFDWADLRIITPTAARPHSPAAEPASTADQRARTAHRPLASLLRATEPNPATPTATPEPPPKTPNGTLTPSPPTTAWLTSLLGDRPADVAGAATWHDAVPTSPTGGPPPTPRQHTRARLAALPTTRPGAVGRSSPGTRPHPSLARRHRPPRRPARPTAGRRGAPTSARPARRAARHLPARLAPHHRPAAAGQLSLDDTPDLLRAALDGQHARRPGSSPTGPTSSNTKRSTRTAGPP